MRMAPEAVATLLGATTTAASGVPLAGTAIQAVMLPALKAILNDRAEEKNRLTQAHVEALVNGPYEVGMEYLNQAAQEYRKAEDRKEYIREAFREFMRARGQQEHEFRRALIEYQLGNSCALLAKKEDARQWFQRSYTSAMNYLYNRKTAVFSSIDPSAKLRG